MKGEADFSPTSIKKEYFETIWDLETLQQFRNEIQLRKRMRYIMSNTCITFWISKWVIQ